MPINSIASNGNKDFHREIFDVVKTKRLVDGIADEQGLSAKDIVRKLEATTSWLDEKQDIDEESRARLIKRTIDQMMLDYEEPFILSKKGATNLYKASSGFEFPTEQVDSPTALTLLMAKDLLHHSLPSVCHKQLNNHLGDIEGRLKKSSRSEYLNWKAKVAWYPEGYSNHMGDISDISSSVFDAISQAVFLDKKIKAKYFPRYKEDSKSSEINPLGLVNRGSIIYLVATYWNYDNIVHLPLYRFSNVEVLNKEVHKPANFDLQTYIAEGGLLKKAFDGEEVQVTLKASKYLLEHFQERQPGIPGSFSSDEEQGTATFEQVITNEFIWWLRAMGPNVKVLQPESLIDSLKKDLEKTLAQY